MLFNEPKLLKSPISRVHRPAAPSFSALQRAEIAEIVAEAPRIRHLRSFSALQRAEIAEMLLNETAVRWAIRFSALQRAEIAEI